MRVNEALDEAEKARRKKKAAERMRAIMQERAEERKFFASLKAADEKKRAYLEARDREYAAWAVANNVRPKVVQNRDGTTTEIRGQEVTGTVRRITQRGSAQVDTNGEGVAIFIRATAALRGKSSGLDTLSAKEIIKRQRAAAADYYREQSRKAKKARAK